VFHRRQPYLSDPSRRQQFQDEGFTSLHFSLLLAIFIIALTRFRWEVRCWVKVLDFANIPQTMSRKTFDPEMIGSNRTFNMVATVVHCGTMSHVHYMFVESSDSECQLFDDGCAIELVDHKQIKRFLVFSPGEWGPYIWRTIMYGDWRSYVQTP
jgi:hypothetical protein